MTVGHLGGEQEGWAEVITSLSEVQLISFPIHLFNTVIECLKYFKSNCSMEDSVS